MKMIVEDPSLIPVGSKFPFLVLQVVLHTCLPINFDIENVGCKTCEVEKRSIILLNISCRRSFNVGW